MTEILEGIRLLIPRLENENRTQRVRMEMVIEMKEEYFEKRDAYLETIPKEYRIEVKRDKDKLFEYAALLFINDPLGVEYSTQFHEEIGRDLDYIDRKKEVFDIVFTAEPEMHWVWVEEWFYHGFIQG